MTDPSWKNGRWTMNEAIEFCTLRDISITRPTASMWLRTYNLGIQLGVRGKYVVDAYRWKLFVLEGSWFEDKPTMD